MVATKNLLVFVALPVVLANTEETDAGLRGTQSVRNSVFSLLLAAHEAVHEQTTGKLENRQLFWGAVGREAAKAFGRAAPAGAAAGYAADQMMNGSDDDDDGDSGSSGGGGGCTIM